MDIHDYSLLSSHAYATLSYLQCEYLNLNHIVVRETGGICYQDVSFLGGGVARRKGNFF